MQLFQEKETAAAGTGLVIAGLGKVQRLDSAMLVLLDLWGWISPRIARISSVRPGKVRRLSAFDYGVRQ